MKNKQTKSDCKVGRVSSMKKTSSEQIFGYGHAKVQVTNWFDLIEKSTCF